MNPRLLLIIGCAAIYSGCHQAGSKINPPGKKSPFVYKETIVRGKDTGIIRLGGFKRINIADNLCQRWQLQNRKDITSSIVPDLETRKSIARDIVCFKDSTAVLNPMGNIRCGNWRIRTENKQKLLVLSFGDSIDRSYIIDDLSSTSMTLIIRGIESLLLEFSAPAEIHQDMRNDPFHPVNNGWRIKPANKETDSAIVARIKNCLLFYALYYRDHIKRSAKTISFEGLPSIFTWYNGGIGLPDQDELTDSWINCFYNEEQALQGYAILRKLIVDYEFNWPRGAPSWIYRTHSVLEQMYHKVDDLK